MSLRPTGGSDFPAQIVAPMRDDGFIGPENRGCSNESVAATRNSVVRL
jgi:hypothetical protein